VILAAPDAEAILKRRREAIRAAAKARGKEQMQSATSTGAQADLRG
jgi:hypothetical protein